MKKTLIFLTLFFLNLSVFSQAKTKSVELYDLGNIAYANKNYKKADSLFTLSLELERYPDTYFNRGASRKKLNDICGYCLDMQKASQMFDKEAKNIYDKDCEKTDTILSKDGDKPAKLSDFETAEFYTSYAYKPNIIYEKYNKKSDLLIHYELIKLDTLYMHSSQTIDPMFIGGKDSLAKYLTRNFLRITKEKKFISWSPTFISVSMDENGKVTNASVTNKETSPVLDSLCLALKNGPNWSGAKMNGRSVSFKTSIYFKIYSNAVIIEELLPYKRSVGEVFTKVEEMPDFPGGPMEMMKFIQTNIKYPKKARKANIAGKCWLRFVIDKYGAISSIEVLKGVAGCPECDAEAIRVVASMPLWKPGKQNGNPVSVFFNLPINFTLK